MRIIICGAGQVGFNLARYLSEHGNEVTVIDSSPELIAHINDRLDIRAILGNASYPQVLADAGAENADLLIAVTKNDEVNMVACEIAQALYQIPKKISRVRAQAYLQPQWRHIFSQNNLSIDVVISPEVEVAQAISRSLTVPGAVDMMSLAGDHVKVIAVRCTQDTPLINTPISHIGTLFPELHMSIVGIVRGDENIIPTSSDLILAGDEVYFLAENAMLVQAMEAFGYTDHESRRLLIIGGGNIGLCLAQEIEKNHPEIQAVVVEKNPARASMVAQELRKTLVLCGDALDREVLFEASVGLTETVVALTDDDRVNTLVALLSKRLGAKRAVSLINSGSYVSLVTSLGVDAVISPRSVTVSQILHHVRMGRIRSVYSLGDQFGEIIEAETSEASGLVGAEVEEVEIPHTLLVAAIVRGEEVIIPTPKETLRLGDRVIFMAALKAIPKIEKMFSANVDYY
ncbi:MAG: Trk system potassium transporter TrkA [Holosporales bacterium]